MAGENEVFEVADLARLARRGVRSVVRAARTSEEPVQPDQLIGGHVGELEVPVLAETWPSWDHVNVQGALDHWLAEPGRRHHLHGLTNARFGFIGLADLVQPPTHNMPRPRLGSVSLTQVPAGPAGEVRSCVRYGLYLVTEPDGSPLVLLVGEGQNQGGDAEVRIEGLGPDPVRLAASLAELRTLAVRHSVFRGRVITFEGEVLGHRRGQALHFVERPSVERDALVLPPGALEVMERQILGVGEHRDRLRSAGQHLKRGLLLYGPPGTGKTHTIRYLLGRLEGSTVLLLSANALTNLGAACSLARSLEPAVVVVEDVDLIAEQRGLHSGGQPLLFRLLNEMDGLREDVDVAFILTTNRVDVLEPALAARPGRIDQAVEIPLPGRAARRRLLEVYRGGLPLEVADLDAVVARTEGVTASFLKEVLRRAALVAAEANGLEDRIDVRRHHLTSALDELLESRDRVTRTILGG